MIELSCRNDNAADSREQRRTFARTPKVCMCQCVPERVFRAKLRLLICETRAFIRFTHCCRKHCAHALCSSFVCAPDMKYRTFWATNFLPPSHILAPCTNFTQKMASRSLIYHSADTNGEQALNNNQFSAHDSGPSNEACTRRPVQLILYNNARATNSNDLRSELLETSVLARMR